MMRAVLVVGAALAMVACGSNNTGGTGGGSGGNGGGGGSGGGAGGGSGAATCAGYCTDIMGTCTGSVAQFPTMESCLGACAAYPQGAVGATTGNSLECRNNFLHDTGLTTAMRCPSSGPTGANGSCGVGDCEAFCTIAQTACTGANQQFNNVTQCTNACGGYAMNMVQDYNDNTMSGNSFACRMYHLSVAASSSANATTHCPHIVANSTACQ
jgi:hypothetical protein